MRKELEFDTKFNSFVAERKRQLFDTKQLLATDSNFTRAMKFSSGETRQIVEKIERELLEGQQKYLDEAEAKETVKRNNRAAAYAAHLDKVEAEAKKLYEKALVRREEDYAAACSTAENAVSETQYVMASQMFSAEKLINYKDCDQRAAECRQKAEELKAQRLAAEEAERKRIAAEKAEQQRLAREAEQQRRDKEAAEMAERKRRAEEEAERKRIADEKRKEEQRARNKKYAIFAVIAAVIAVALFLVIKIVVLPANAYKAAEALYAEGRYTEALAAFDALGGYKDSALRTETIANEIYANAEKLMANGEYGKAAIIFSSLGNYKDATTRNKELWTIMGNSGLWHTISASKNLTYLTTVCLKFYGTVEAVGDNSYGQRDVHDWKDIVAVSTGDHHTVGLKTDGTVVAVGDNVDGRCNVSDWKDIVAVSAGAIHTVGLKSDGTVVAVGDNEYGRSDVHDWKDIVAVSAGGFYTVGLKTDGTVLLAGPVIRDVQRHISSWTNIKLPEA